MKPRFIYVFRNRFDKIHFLSCPPINCDWYDTIVDRDIRANFLIRQKLKLTLLINMNTGRDTMYEIGYSASPTGIVKQ